RQYFQVPDKFAFQGQILSHRTRRFGKDWHRSAQLAGALAAMPAPNIVVGGNYFMPDARTARRFCSANRKRFYFWGEYPFKKQESGPKRWLKTKYLAWFLRPAAGVIGIGREATEAYRQLSGGRPAA